MNSRFDGMTTNERLWKSGLDKEYEEAMEAGNVVRVHQILDEIGLPQSKKLFPAKSGTDAIFRHFANALTKEELSLRDQLIAEYEAAKSRGDMDTLRKIIRSLGIRESSLRWPLDAKPKFD